MLGSMMRKDLLISDLIVHAGKYHADTEIVSRETSGEINTTTWAEVAVAARRLASALTGLGLDQGEWISSVDLENIAVSHPGVAMAAAIGAKHPKWDERPIIVAAGAEGAEPSEQEIIDLFEGKVAKWQIPDAVVFTDAIPLNGTGKMLKNKLRERFGETLVEKGI